MKINGYKIKPHADLRWADLYGAYLKKADLSYADLSRAYLKKADLREADLYGANLRNANLSYADLYGANLYGANLSYADLYGATLRDANLYGANLSKANLYGANLRDANLCGANLSKAYLYGADLYGTNLKEADLKGANLSEADLSNTILPTYKIFPEKGSFNCFKKLRLGVVAELFVPSKAKRMNSLVGRKGRVSECKVIKFINSDTKQIGGLYRNSFVYTVGEYVYPDRYCDDIRIECSHGIHVFLTQEEAEEW